MSEAVEPTWLCPGCDVRVPLYAGGHPFDCAVPKHREVLRQSRALNAGRLERLICRVIGHNKYMALVPNYRPFCWRCGEDV